VLWFTTEYLRRISRISRLPLFTWGVGWYGWVEAEAGKDFLQGMGVLVEMLPRKQRTRRKMRVRKAGIVTKVYSSRRPFSYTELTLTNVFQEIIKI
jgi:hypothetical protein